MRLRPVLAALAVAMAATACAPVTSHQGFQAIETMPKDVKVGVDTKSTVTEKLGSPSSISTFDTTTWYYISQITDRVSWHKPAVKSRDIVAISFDKASEQVASVNSYTLKDGKVIAFNGRETPTRGRELSILEQLLGNVGRGSLAPQDDTAPGSRPGR
jgi:outer membrane protein assembly factor BamE (lipoprotein component of BamABCDE complex)